jgi:predicted unusual protein kinase regulating ubiquinone biosynthesis (AarF/ABC1/UbiB family)
VPALLAEFTRILHEEIDYLAEGRNAEMFAAHFKDRPQVRIPRVIWTHTTRRVLTLEDVSAIKITDYAAITAAGIDRAEVARLLFDTYLKQIFEDGFFHADPHPGNLFVSPLTPSPDSNDAGRPAWRLTFIDFGMVGRVPPNLRAGLREVIIAIGMQDSARLVRAYQKLGVLLPSADLELLERAEAKVFERFWGKTMTELRQIGLQQVQEFANEFRELLYSMPFQVPEDLILLGRTFGILSGMCTGLDADFNFWTGLVPYAQKLVAEEATSGWEFWLNELGDLARTLLSLPKRMDATLSKLEQGQVAVRVPQLTEQVLRLELAMRRLVGGTIFAALLLGGVQLYVAAQRGLGSALLVGAAVVLLWVILAGRR